MIYAVGDVHGRIDELERVLGLVRAHAAEQGIARPTVVFLGDVIDRGLATRQVVERLMGARLREEVDPIVLRGNHEQMLVDAATDWSRVDMWLHHGGADTVESYGVIIGGKTPKRFLPEFYRDALPEAHRLWMAGLPLTHQVGNLLFVHAGIDPNRSPKQQRPADLLWIRKPFLEHPGPYPGKLRVVHGHSPDRQVFVSDHRIGVDTGCGFPGGRLSAVAIADDGAVTVL